MFDTKCTPQGDSIAGGYWNRPEESATTFGARIEGADAEFLRTGDLGFLDDGQLFIRVARIAR